MMIDFGKHQVWSMDSRKEKNKTGTTTIQLKPDKERR